MSGNPVVEEELKVAGFDPGRNYIAWAVITGNHSTGFRLYRHGFIYPQSLGETKDYGSGLHLWPHFFELFLREDLEVYNYAVERFIKMQGSAGSSSEDVNLRVAHMRSPGGFLVRNVDWKSWFKKYVNKDGTHAVFKTSTPHEADAAGIALYTACVLMKRHQKELLLSS